MRAGRTAVSRSRHLLRGACVLMAIFAAGLAAAGTVSGAGPLAAFAVLSSAAEETGSDSTETTDTTSTDTPTTDSTETETTTTESTESIETETTTEAETETTPPPTGPPTIASDKPDYEPGETVVLRGENWVAGELVHIRVNDDQGETWRRDVDVIANGEGKITDTFALPTTFVAVYTVTATGPVPGTRRPRSLTGTSEFAPMQQARPSRLSGPRTGAPTVPVQPPIQTPRAQSDLRAALGSRRAWGIPSRSNWRRRLAH